MLGGIWRDFACYPGNIMTFAGLNLCLEKVAIRAEKTDSSFFASIYLAATHRLTIISTALGPVVLVLQTHP